MEKTNPEYGEHGSWGLPWTFREATESRLGNFSNHEFKNEKKCQTIFKMGTGYYPVFAFSMTKISTLNEKEWYMSIIWMTSIICLVKLLQKVKMFSINRYSHY